MNLFGINGWEMVVIALIALLVIGPDKLPGFVADARRMLRQVKRLADDARTEVTSQLGPEFQDIDIKDLNPRSFVKKHLFDGDDLELDSLNPFAPEKDDGRSAPTASGAHSLSKERDHPGETYRPARDAATPADADLASRWDADAT